MKGSTRSAAHEGAIMKWRAKGGIAPKTFKLLSVYFDNMKLTVNFMCR